MPLIETKNVMMPGLGGIYYYLLAPYHVIVYIQCQSSMISFKS